MASDRVVEALLALGFNLNEARAYVGLLARGASTGYEVAQHAGVPRSAVYTSLRRLVTEGAARREPGPPERFTATPSEALIGLLTKRMQRSTGELREAVATLDVAPGTPDAFSVQGHARILEEAARVVRSARHTLVISGWPRELSLLVPDIAGAIKRGVYLVTFSHATIPSDVGGVRFSYGLREADLETFWKHRLVVVADDTISLVGSTEDRPTDRAVVSETAAIAEIVVSQVALDVTLLVQRHDVDVSDVMARMLGDRVGRLDSLLTADTTPELGASRRERVKMIASTKSAAPIARRKKKR